MITSIILMIISTIQMIILIDETICFNSVNHNYNKICILDFIIQNLIIKNTQKRVNLIIKQNIKTNNKINKQTNTFHSTSQNKIKNKINFKKNVLFRHNE